MAVLDEPLRLAWIAQRLGLPAGTMHRMKILAVATMTLAVASYALAGCGSGSNLAAVSTIPVSGKVALIDDQGGFAEPGQPTCGGTGGYSDITEGAQVIIADDSGKTLALTKLSAGVPPKGDEPFDRCTFTFQATVPAGKAFYGVVITHRGTVKFTEAKIKTPELTIGSPG